MGPQDAPRGCVPADVQNVKVLCDRFLFRKGIGHKAHHLELYNTGNMRRYGGEAVRMVRKFWDDELDHQEQFELIAGG